MLNNTEKKKLVTSLASERDFLISRSYVPRTQESNLVRVLETESIKAIIGPRRSGKSTLAIDILHKQYPDFFYLNFDNKQLLSVEDLFEFIEESKHQFQNGNVVFLDEVQNVPDFELTVSRLQRNGYNVVISGSNANLLSRELSTHLTGRYVEIEVLPFSYSEALQLDPNLTVEQYLMAGGFPEQLINRDSLTDYLDTLFESIVLKDIVVRHNLRNVDDLLRLKNYFVNTPAQLTSYTNLKNKLDLASTNTVISYYSHLQEAYLIFNLGFYSPKQSEILSSGFKTYLIDTGSFWENPAQFNRNLGYLFENAVFIELVRAGYEPNKNLFQAKLAKGEIDFLIKTEEKDIVIQTSLSVKDNDTREREFKPLSNYSSFNNKPVERYVVVAESGEQDLAEEGIEVVEFGKLAGLIAVQ